jgi:hypothetical protein
MNDKYACFECGRLHPVTCFRALSLGPGACMSVLPSPNYLITSPFTLDDQGLYGLSYFLDF